MIVDAIKNRSLKMKRKVENQTDLPVVEIIMNPADSRPVVVTMPSEFELTGEIQFSPGTASDLLELAQKLDFIRDAMADEAWSRRIDEATRERVEKGKPPTIG
jgi:hypothetical protein